MGDAMEEDEEYDLQMALALSMQVGKAHDCRNC
jgi:hypothetical protein